jgi:hypothetical protein
MSTTLLSTLTKTSHSLNAWRKNTNKSTLSIGDLTTVYSSDGAGSYLVNLNLSKYVIANIQTATWVNSIATITTSQEHNLVSDPYKDIVVISGTGAGWDGTYQVENIVNDYTFTVTIAVQPTTYAGGGILRYNTIDAITAINDLNSRKVKRSGDAIVTLSVTSDTDSSSTSTGALIVSGGVGIAKKLFIGGDVTVGANKFTISATSGNTAIAGTLGVSSTLSVGANFSISSAGNVVTTGTLQSGAVTASSISLTTPLPAASGGTGISSVTGHGNKLLGINSTGNAYEIKQITGAAGIIVTHGVNSITIASDGSIPSGSSTDTFLRIGQQVLVGSWNGTVHNSITPTATLELRPAAGVTINNLLKISSANDGSQDVVLVSSTGVTSLLATTESSSTSTGVLVVSGGVGIAKKLFIGGDVTVGANKFTVAAASGNTAITGTLGVSGATTVGAINATALNVSGVGSALTLTPTTAGSISNCSVSATTLSASGDVAINTNKFNIAAASGNTSIGGTLGVSGTTTLDGNTYVSLNTWLGNDVGRTTTVGLDCAITTYRTSTTSTTLNQPYVLDLSSKYQSGELIIQAKEGTNLQTTHILFTCSTTDINSTEFGRVVMNNIAAEFGMDINAGNIRLLISPSSSSSTTYRITSIYTSRDLS